MRILIGLLLSMFASSAAAQPLEVFGFDRGTNRSEIADQLRNCQPSPNVPGRTVCVLDYRDIEGIPLIGEFALAEFQYDQLDKISMVVSGSYEGVSQLLQRFYGTPAQNNSNRVRQSDGRMATIRFARWDMDDGQIELGTAEIAGQSQGNTVRFSWRP